MPKIEAPFQTMKRRFTYQEPSLCIVCSVQRGTTLEHIIPRALGGELLVPSGTCEQCLALMNSTEGALMNSDFSAARAILGIRTKSRRRIDKAKIFEPADPHAREYKGKMQHVEQHSGLVALHTFPPPGIERGGNLTEPFHYNIGVALKVLWPAPARPDITFFDPSNKIKFARLLAKIAHVYWIAEHGAGSISHALPCFIKAEETDGIMFFVGGGPSGFLNNDLHNLNAGVRKINGMTYGYVDIGLFSYCLPETNYRVYVGLCTT